MEEVEKVVKIVIYKDYDNKGQWIWELHMPTGEIESHGTEGSFNSAYETAKQKRLQVKLNRKKRKKDHG